MRGEKNMAVTQICPDQAAERLPIAALLALAMTGFLALLVETIPAGMLLHISDDMGISETLAGQFVTLYAIGSLVAAIPLTAATQGWRRRPLLMTALSAMLVFNMITALTTSYSIALITRFLAGMAVGLIWGMLAGYARRLVVDSLKGRALAIAGIGAPLALSLGVPLGTLLSGVLGWRVTFVIISLMALLVLIWIWIKVPDFSGQKIENRISILRVMSIPGIMPVLLVVGLWVLAHNILYTYIMPFLVPLGLVDQVDLILLIFGVASFAGILITGVWIDQRLRHLVLLSLMGFALAAVILGVAMLQPIIVYLAIAVWGLTFGGAATLLQTALANAADSHADIAQSVLVTVWNSAIAGGGIIGGILLLTSGANIFPWVIFGLIILAGCITLSSNQYGFPSR
ncbi:MFS transporter [Acinetobacter populi]|uniref:MFS transporter n=2 Tax=Acinetobacter populi TaxID=1582270 RepID=A0A1Z9YVS3_9GAMM|nr:MFS transporter [Acinetobacter populi]